MKDFFASTGRVLLTLVVVLVAIAVGWQLWSYYMLEPWTRDGRVRADVVTIAPDVSGLVTAVLVRGDVLFRIDPERFELALQQADAAMASRKAEMDEAAREATRY